jgi:hypothetical protein
VATKAEVLLLQHPGTGEITVPKTRTRLAEQLEAEGLARCRFTRAGALKLSLTSDGVARQQELQLASINRGRAPTPAPPPTTPRPAAPRPAVRKPAAPLTPAPAARKPAARKPAAHKPAARKPAARKPAAPGTPAAPRIVATPVIPSPRKPLPPTKRVPSLDDLFGEGAFHPEAAEQRPVTMADLRAFEQRILDRLDQLATEIAARTPRV